AAVTDGPASRLPSKTPAISADFKSIFRLIGNNDDDDDDDDGNNNGNNGNNSIPSNLQICSTKPWKDKCKNACDSTPSYPWCTPTPPPACVPTQTCTPNPPVVNQLTVAANSDTDSKGPNAGCDTPAVLPLTGDRTSLLTAINNQIAESSTNVTAGFIWGWKTISPNGPYAALAPDSIKPYGSEKNNKVIILMTDGDTSMSSSNYSTFGYFRNERLGPKNGNNNFNDYLDAGLNTACTNAKAAGVTIYTIAYGNGGSTSNTSPMALCASSVANHFLKAADATELAA
ncbi:MAG: hypothetical protein NWT00_09740, partial [Beijerinckiaceae bacterium]|nr:hypothetical protein [Beijerinckiaceae bacterium]